MTVLLSMGPRHRARLRDTAAPQDARDSRARYPGVASSAPHRPHLPAVASASIPG